MAIKVSENILRLARLNKEDYYSKNATDDAMSATERANMLSRVRGAQKTMKTNPAYAPYLALKAYAHLAEPDVTPEAEPEPEQDSKVVHATRMKTWRANNRDASRKYMREYMRGYRDTKRELL